MFRSFRKTPTYCVVVNERSSKEVKESTQETTIVVSVRNVDETNVYREMYVIDLGLGKKIRGVREQISTF